MSETTTQRSVSDAGSPDLRTASGYDSATEPKRPDASLGELISELTTEVSTLFRKEIELAKTEAREKLATPARQLRCSALLQSPVCWPC